MTSPCDLYCHYDDFHQKNIDKLVQDQFLQPVKDHPYDKFGYVGKIMPCFFFKHAKTKFICQKSKNLRLSVLKIRWNARSRICDH